MKPLVTLFACLALSACASITPPAKPGTVDHIVLVWLNRPGNASDRTSLIHEAERLRKIPGIRILDAGTALPSDRPVVDDSFDVGFVMRFESAKALQEYDSHPTHLAARKRLRELSRKIVVYDITR